MFRTIFTIFAIVGVLLCGAIGCESSSSSNPKPPRDKGSMADQHLRNFGMYD